MNIMVVGRRAAEHALAWQAAQDTDCDNVYITRDPEDGSREMAVSVPLSPTDIDGLRRFAKQNVDLTIVGHEAPLNAGIGDAFREDNLLIFAPSQAAAELETNKVFSKRLMIERGIPTAEFRDFDIYEDAVSYIRSRSMPVMIKASGPAQARGTESCHSIDDAEDYLAELMVELKAGDAGRTVVIEDFLTGPEVSLHAWCDGKTYQMFPASQDHKHLYDNDVLPMTGGMGVVAPLPPLPRGAEEILGQQFIPPVLRGLAKLGIDYSGVLYPGIMLTPNGPKALEYNVRFGGPEAEVYMRLLRTSLPKMALACIDGQLDKEAAVWSGQYAACVVMASEGYPGVYNVGYPIEGLEEAKKVEGVEIFHGGTRYTRGRYVTNGGRVLSITALADSLELAVRRAYQAVEEIDFKGKYYRKDIGRKILSMGRLVLV